MSWAWKRSTPPSISCMRARASAASSSFDRRKEPALMATLESLSTNRSHGGVQGVYKHRSVASATDMVFSVFVPPHAEGAKLPVVWYLSGLTCTHANVTEKGEFRAACA